VTDNGLPARSASESITIIVSEINSAPVLNPIGDKNASEGRQLSFTASASDSDLPAQALTFSLGAGAPAGAVIGTANGLFSWTPPTGSPATNSITVVVTDNGSPVLTASQTFAVIVVHAPRMSTISVSGGVATLVWESFPGKHYQLQRSSDLENWSDTGGLIEATSSSASTTHSIAGSPAQFYRVGQVD
jgi:hypothetical protein